MGVLELLLPPACAGCGRFGHLVCRECLEGFRAASAPDDRFMASDPGTVVGDALELAITAFAHDGTLRRALQRLKYGGSGRIAVPLARAAAPALVALTRVCGPLPLVPVPVHSARLNQRGYNQAALLADSLGSATRLPVLDILERGRATVRQHGLGKAARLQNLRGAFALRESVRIPPGIILVDDILTTSATLESCAQVLRDAGAAAVYGFAIAREV
ncbi:MAG: ComF family protein [Chloroflexi bacterium]|nr:ComF family protein [Chloroflexota bacterium]